MEDWYDFEWRKEQEEMDRKKKDGGMEAWLRK